MILSNNLAYVADAAFSSIGNMSVLLAWLGAIAYTLQIYFDFSGYSDMAIGLGRMFGFRIRENFNYPYISRSVSEFWRRWHISGQLVPRLLVHPFGWQPCEKPWTAYFQLVCGVVFYWPLAWCQLDIHCLGSDVFCATLC